jgi:hypothetical protein
LCAGTPTFHTVAFSLLQTEFSPKIQTEVTRTLNTKVVEQVTLYNICNRAGTTCQVGQKLGADEQE